MSAEGKKEIPSQFNSPDEMTLWILDRLEENHQKDLFEKILKKTSRFIKAKEALKDGNWEPSRQIVEKELNTSGDALISEDNPALIRALFWSRLLSLVGNQMSPNENLNDEELLGKLNSMVSKIF